MKICADMNLARLAQALCVRAPSRAAWAEVRRQLVARHDGRDTRTLTIGELWRVQRAAFAYAG